MSAPEGWQADIKIRERLQDACDARTPADWARIGLRACAELAGHHEQHFPGDPVRALRNVVDVARGHVSRAEFAEERADPRRAEGFEHVSEPIERVVKRAADAGAPADQSALLRVE